MFELQLTLTLATLLCSICYFSPFLTKNTACTILSDPACLFKIAIFHTARLFHTALQFDTAKYIPRFDIPISKSHKSKDAIFLASSTYW